MKFWPGFFMGALTYGIIMILLTTPPDKAAENLRAWAQVFGVGQLEETRDK